MTMIDAMRSVGFSLNRLLSQSNVATRAYIQSSAAVLRRMPDSMMRRRLVRVLASGPWPQIEFAPRTVTVGHATPLTITPRTNEYDFHALYESRLQYEHEVFAALEARLRDYDAIIEIGANVGIFTLFFAKQLERSGREVPVFAFEPSRDAFKLLLRNLELNGARNVHPFNCAVAQRTGVFDFFEPRGHLTNGSLLESFASFFSSEVVKNKVLAVSGELVSELLAGYDRILLKVDVEGTERAVLEGLEPVIRAWRPDIVLEVLDPFAEELNQVAVLNDLYVRDHITHAGLVRRDRFAAEGGSRDYLLTPRASSTSQPRSAP